MDDADLMAGLLDEVQDEAQLMYDSEEDIAATSEQVPVVAANLDYHPSGKCDCADSASAAFILTFHLNIPQTTPSCARGVSASSWPSRWLVARSVAWSMHTRRLSYLYLVLSTSYCEQPP